MKAFLFVALIQYFLNSVDSITGVIWNKELRAFISLYKVPAFNAVKRKVLDRSRLLETHDFSGEALIIAYYQEKNIFMFEANDTKVSGISGEIWTILSEYLNFTLVPRKTLDRGFGMKQKNNSYSGLLGIIERKEAQIVPRSGLFSNRLKLMEYTMPLWTTRYRLFIKPEWKHDGEWVFHIFSLSVWMSILVIFILLSLASYILQTYAIASFPSDLRFNLAEHFFNTITLMVSQGSVRDSVYNQFKILSLCKSFFSWLILLAISAHTITRMMNKTLIPPFTNLETLLKDSQYKIIAFEGSMVREEFQKEISLVARENKIYKRIFRTPYSEVMYNTVCFSNSKFALFDAEDRESAVQNDYCHLKPIGTSYFETWIASGVVRGFKFKRSFDIGLLKLNEFGLTDGLKDRWLNFKLNDKIGKHFESIGMDQVYLIFLILLSGMSASLLIIIIEFVMYACQALKRDFDKKKLKLKSNKNVKKKSIRSYEINRW